MRRTIRHIFILTIKHLLHVRNKQNKPTHHDNKHIRTHEFNVVHPKLGYVHNDWLLMLFIHIIHYIHVHCAHTIILVKTQTFPMSFYVVVHTYLLTDIQLSSYSSTQQNNQLFNTQ
jgi:hypothetical protein